MKFFSVIALVLALGVGMSAGDAEAARRIGGGKSVGMQRQATTPDKAPTATPAQTPGTPASAAAPAAPAAAAAGTAAAAQPKRSWMGPLAGIAAGLGLAALASHFGFGDELASMLMIGLAVMAVLAVVGFVMRKRAAAQAGAQGTRTAFAGAGAGGAEPGARAFEVAMPAPAATPTGGSMIGANLAPAPVGGKIPADFDVASFVRNAKVQFIRLQAANDAGNLDDIRGFTTPEMFAEIQMDMAERAGAVQNTEVLQLDADVIEVVEDAQRYVVSVRFTGTIREAAQAQAQAPAEAFDELWHLVKPRQGSGGWVLAGIQQAS
ncbi:Tim44 domain-containing protein [Hydrogenophaga sp. OTU3427]|uniref:Tim44 domain-containing protein n=1 Tax=Hydrogenophaga sp. OTU3427 TaxID=3043856 RepID=UPI00313F3C1F